MRHLLLAPLLLALASPANAGLDEAEKTNQAQSFDVWCANKGNECKVSLDNARLKVNRTLKIQ